PCLHRLLASSMPRPPGSTLFPYTTLFRSAGAAGLPTFQRIAILHAAGIVLEQLAGGDAKGQLPDAGVVDLAGEAHELGAHVFTRSEEHTSELQSRENLVCRLLLEKKNKHQ